MICRMGICGRVVGSRQQRLHVCVANKGSMELPQRSKRSTLNTRLVTPHGSGSTLSPTGFDRRV